MSSGVKELREGEKERERERERDSVWTVDTLTPHILYPECGPISWREDGIYMYMYMYNYYTVCLKVALLWLLAHH